MAKGVISVSLPLELAVQIERLAEERGCSISFLVKQLLEEALEIEKEREEREPEFAVAGD